MKFGHLTRRSPVVWLLIAVAALVISTDAEAAGQELKSKTSNRHAAKEDEPALIDRVAKAAREARETCFPRIHHDTLMFEGCVRDLAEKPGRDLSERLGATYFGWVGAMNSARMGMLGSADSAARFLQQFTRLQQKLHIGDQALCQAVPGDCDTRIAQISNQRQSPRLAMPAPFVLSLPSEVRSLWKSH